MDDCRWAQPPSLGQALLECGIRAAVAGQGAPAGVRLLRPTPRHRTAGCCPACTKFAAPARLGPLAPRLQLFASFSVVEAAADPVTEAVPPQVGGADGGDVALGGGEEGGEGDEHEGEDDAAEAEADSPTSTGGKKKKRRPKKKGAQGGSQPAEVGGATVGSPRGAEDAPTPAAGSPRQPGSPPAARPSTPPVTASPLASPRAAVASPRTRQLHADAPPFTPRSMRARAATPFGVPEPSSPAAPRSASPRAAQSSPTAAASKPARAAGEGASPTAPAPVAAATATPPKPASPKVPTCYPLRRALHCPALPTRCAPACCLHPRCPLPA